MDVSKAPNFGQSSPPVAVALRCPWVELTCYRYVEASSQSNHAPIHIFQIRASFYEIAVIAFRLHTT